MKTLSVKNPWAHLLVSGLKDVENRPWKTNFRGKILIHCSQTFDIRHREMSLLFTPKQWKSLSPREQVIQTHGLWQKSAIIGQVEIVDCIQNSKSIWAEPNQWHWIIANPVKFDEPILNVKGKLSFWEYENMNDGTIHA